jgi:hypothetical protein
MGGKRSLENKAARTMNGWRFARNWNDTGQNRGTGEPAFRVAFAANEPAFEESIKTSQR